MAQNDLGAPVFITNSGANPIATGSGGTNTQPTVTSDGAAAKFDRSIAASTTSQQVAAGNAVRRRLIFQNLDAAINVHVNIGAVATTGLGSIRLAPGAYLDVTGTSGAVNIMAASGAPLVTVWEF